MIGTRNCSWRVKKERKTNKTPAFTKQFQHLFSIKASIDSIAADDLFILIVLLCFAVLCVLFFCCCCGEEFLFSVYLLASYFKLFMTTFPVHNVNMFESVFHHFVFIVSGCLCCCCWYISLFSLENTLKWEEKKRGWSDFLYFHCRRYCHSLKSIKYKRLQ